MPESKSIAAQLAQAVLDQMNAAGIETQDFDMSKMLNMEVGSLRRPAVSVAIDQSTFSKLTMRSYKANLIVIIFLMVSNVSVRGEKQNRLAILDLIEAIIDSLILEKLNLPLQDPLIPIGFENLTPIEKMGAGYQVYQIRFSCSHCYEKPDPREKDEGRLKKIVADYFLQDPSDDGMSDASSQILLTGLDGGDAYSVYGRQIDGGSAGSKYKADPWDGGNANTQY